MTGRELDAEVAEKVMGWHMPSNLARYGVGKKELMYPFPEYNALAFPPNHPMCLKTVGGYEFWTMNKAEQIPFFSESIEAAFQVVEKMRERGYEFGLSGFFMAEKRWLAEFWKDDMSRKEEFYTTAPEAICRAALSALTTLKEQGHAG